MGKGSYDGVESTGTSFLFEVQEGKGRGGEEGTLVRVEERKGSGRGVEDVLVARTRVVDSLALALPWLCCSPREWEAREAAEEERREGKKRGRKKEDVKAE